MSEYPYRKTRIVCISDTHNQTPSVPPGDILIHAGDLTNQGSVSELTRQVRWLQSLPHEAKIIIAGNHDTTLDRQFFANGHGDRMHNQIVQDPDTCIRLLRETQGITYLDHERLDLVLTSPCGPRTNCSIFGSPYSPAKGTWAFGYDTQDDGVAARAVWDAIPADIDVLITHTPPAGHCDTVVAPDGDTRDALRPNAPRAGCPELTKALRRVKPSLHVCGHIHEARGAERVIWPTQDSSKASPVEKPLLVDLWSDPAGDASSKKQSLVDLTGKKGRRLNAIPSELVGASASEHHKGGVMLEASSRRETCIVNAAIMGRSRFSQTRTLNKPIVVDLLLPTSAA